MWRHTSWLLVAVVVGLIALVVECRNVRLFHASKSEGSEHWDAVTKVLQDAADAKVFPGAAAIVGDSSGTLYTVTIGNYTNDGRLPPFHPLNSPPNPPPTLQTRFDMASCTKVVATTSAVALLYQDGFIGLHDPVQQYLGASYAAQGKANITVLNCLLHNAGYPPDPSPEYWDPVFGCAGRSGERSEVIELN